MIKNVIPRWQIDRLQQYLDYAKNIVITCHVKPDGDAIGSSLAICAFLRNMGKNASVIFPDQVPSNLNFITTECVIPTVYSCHKNRASVLVNRANLILCLDYNAMKRIDKLAEIIEPCKAPKVLIDHHEDPDIAIFKLWLSYPEMSSTCELVYRIIRQMRSLPLIDDFVARCLYLGLMTDTGNFVHNNSDNPEVFEIAAHLLRYNINKQQLYRQAMNTFTANALRLQGYALGEKMEIFPDKGAALIILTREELERFDYHKGDTEGLVNMPLSIPGIKWSTFMREDPTYFKVSMRSEEGFRVDTICTKYFSGGGHELAAGGEYAGSEREIRQLYRQILNETDNSRPVEPILKADEDGDNDSIFEKLNIQ